MRIRAARTVVFTRERGEVVAFNFLTKSAFICSPDMLGFLALVDDWTDVGNIPNLIADTSAAEAAEIVAGLLAVDVLTEEHSERAQTEDQFGDTWRWGIPAALFHFSVQNAAYMSLEQSEGLQRATLEELDPPPLYLKNNPSAAIALPSPMLERNELLALMARRRTVRVPTPEPITLAELSDCLFAGMGIIGETRNCIGALPLSMTPSGGARNPYEAYVYARDVTGLKPGFYHYSAFDHSLERIGSEEKLPKPSELTGGQDWTDEMPCVVFLCAFLERTMWKYVDPNAYRVVMIEAGHIGQNLMLAATRHGLSACPTAALNHAEIGKHIGTGGAFTQAPVYALTLAHPGKEEELPVRREAASVEAAKAPVAEMALAE